MLFFFIQYLWVSNDWNIYSKVALSIQSAASCKKVRRYIRGCHVRTIHALMRMQKNVWTPTGLKHEGCGSMRVENVLCPETRRLPQANGRHAFSRTEGKIDTMQLAADVQQAAVRATGNVVHKTMFVRVLQ
jgi:hypothetical protein